MGRKKYETAGSIKTKNAYMQQIIGMLDEIASYRRIIIAGGMGTGRDTLAKLIHERSAESALPMKKIDCREARLDDMIIDPNVVTYFDDIQNLSKGLRKRLLLELEKNTDAYIISSGCKDILEMGDSGRFPADLFLTLAKIYVYVPEICFRREDIPAMVRDALSKYNKKYQKNVKIESNAMTHLVHYNYRNNINELYSIIERAVLINTTGIIKANSILSVLNADSLSLVTMMKSTNLSLKESLDRYERMLLINAISNTDTAEDAARLLDISRSSLYAKCNKHCLEVTIEGYFGSDAV